MVKCNQDLLYVQYWVVDLLMCSTELLICFMCSTELLICFMCCTELLICFMCSTELLISFMCCTELLICFMWSAELLISFMCSTELLICLMCSTELLICFMCCTEVFWLFYVKCWFVYSMRSTGSFTHLCFCPSSVDRSGIAWKSRFNSWFVNFCKAWNIITSFGCIQIFYWAIFTARIEHRRVNAKRF